MWNGAHGHYEVGNMFVGYVNAFIDSLLLNRHFVIQDVDKPRAKTDGETLRRFVTYFSTRIPTIERKQGHGFTDITESGWEPLVVPAGSRKKGRRRRTADEERCLREATRCSTTYEYPRRSSHATCCSDIIFQCVSHAAYAALIDLPKTRLGSPLAKVARASFRTTFTDPLQFDKVFPANPGAGFEHQHPMHLPFAASIHLRMILPGPGREDDHGPSRNTDACRQKLAKSWIGSSCRESTWNQALARLKAIPAPAAKKTGGIT